MDPIPYYQKDYRIKYKGTFTPRKKHIFRAAHVALNRFAAIRHLLAPKLKVLDVGSGGGEFLYLLKKLGCDAQGIEPNEGYANYARDQYQLNITVGFMQNTPLEDDTFDRVTLWHVLEHMDNPAWVLKRIHSCLKPGGLLVVEVPNVEATCQAPVNTFHMAHLYNFNESTLKRMAGRAGFSMIEKSESEDGGNICQVFKKNGEDSEDFTAEIDGNFASIFNTVTRRTMLRHYLTHYPYTRFLKKIRNGFIENQAARRFTHGRDILDHLMESINRKSLPEHWRAGQGGPSGGGLTDNPGGHANIDC
jgi:ubiquinone/menaquinone biosynthesis C-methylase UbiE